MFDALHRRFAVTKILVDDGWPRAMSTIPGYEKFDACLWFVRFRELIERPAFTWDDFRGVRIMYDWDAYQNANLLGGNRFVGAWPGVFSRNGFHVLVCTGREVRDNLRSEGVDAHWIPKGADIQRFHPLNRPREGFCYFGELYASRAAMLDYLRRHDVKVDAFRCSYFDLNEKLNSYAACLICNMVGQLPAAPLALLNRVFPSRFITHGMAPETMAKNFEAAAAGCVAFADFHPEFEELGFRDGETLVTYRSFEELRDKIIDYGRRPDDLAAIGERGAQLVRERHTWDHRAEEFERLIRARTRADRHNYPKPDGDAYLGSSA